MFKVIRQILLALLAPRESSAEPHGEDHALDFGNDESFFEDDAPLPPPPATVRSAVFTVDQETVEDAPSSNKLGMDR